MSATNFYSDNKDNSEYIIDEDFIVFGYFHSVAYREIYRVTLEFNKPNYNYRVRMFKGTEMVHNKNTLTKGDANKLFSKYMKEILDKKSKYIEG